MKMIKIKNTRDYKDKVTKAIQKAGEIREVDEKRAKEIIRMKCAELVSPAAQKPGDPDKQ